MIFLRHITKGPSILQQYYAYTSLMIASQQPVIHQCLTNDPKCLHNTGIYGHHAYLYSTCRNFPTPLLIKLASIISIFVSFL